MKLFSLLDTQYNAFIKNVSNYISKTLSKDNVSFGSNSIFGQIISVVGNEYLDIWATNRAEIITKGNFILLIQLSFLFGQ